MSTFLGGALFFGAIVGLFRLLETFYVDAPARPAPDNAPGERP